MTAVWRPVLDRCRVALAILSFVIYASSVLLLHQDRSPNAIEWDGSIAWTVECEPLASAISNVVYGAPVGTYFSGVLEFLRAAPVSRYENVERLARRDVPLVLGTPITLVPDGNGVGYILFATLAMHIFGPHLISLIYLFLAFIGISTLAFIFRFRDETLLFVPLTFTALTVMLLTPLVTVTWIQSNVPIGGARYFIAAALLPAFHLIFEITARTDWLWKRRAVDAPPASRGGYLLDTTSLLGNVPHAILIAVQASILVFAFFIRSSSAGPIGAVVLAAIFSLWTARANRSYRRIVLAKIELSVLAGVILAAVMVTSAPSEYVKTGRVFGVFWHRAFISFGLNPQWPFSGVRELYDCTWMNSLPTDQYTHRKGLVPNIDDGNAYCLWYAVNRGRPEADINSELFTKRYEQSLRQAVFTIASLYPKETVETLFYYKPNYILQAIKDAFNFKHAAEKLAVLLLALLQCAAFATFVFLGVLARGGNRLDKPLVIVAFSMLALPQYFVVWATVHTATDLIFYMFAMLMLCFADIIQISASRFAVSRIPGH